MNQQLLISALVRHARAFGAEPQDIEALRKGLGSMTLEGLGEHYRKVTGKDPAKLKAKAA